jgi:hypothetical protein
VGSVLLISIVVCVCALCFFDLFLFVCLRSGSVLCPMFSVPLNGQFLIL